MLKTGHLPGFFMPAKVKQNDNSVVVFSVFSLSLWERAGVRASGRRGILRGAFQFLSKSVAG
jgi:hypothetical protein